MKNTIKGKFSLKATPDPSDEVAQTLGAMRMRFDKVFEGALDAQGTVSMIGIMNKE